MIAALLAILQASSFVPSDAVELPLEQFNIPREFNYICWSKAKYDGVYGIFLRPEGGVSKIDVNHADSKLVADVVTGANITGVKQFGSSGWIFDAQAPTGEKISLRIDIGSKEMPMSMRASNISLDDYTCTLTPTIPTIGKPSK